jgi:hypothetical protein
MIPPTPSGQGATVSSLGGHASMLEYSLLHLFGYGLSMEELKSFRNGEVLHPVIRIRPHSLA